MASSSSTPKTTTTKMTHDLITAPAPGTAIAPLFTYSDEQYAQINALREVSRGLPSTSTDPVLTLFSTFFASSINRTVRT